MKSVQSSLKCQKSLRFVFLKQTVFVSLLDTDPWILLLLDNPLKFAKFHD